MHISEERKAIEFKSKTPISIFLDDERADYKPGCSILELSFADPVTVGEIRFRNNYTAYIRISCKRVPGERDVKNRDILPWQTSVRHFVLMQEPECEKNSQDTFSVSVKESAIPWSGIVSMRIILKQPSFRWKKFSIEELSIYGDSVKESKQLPVPHVVPSSRRSECKTPAPEQDKIDSAMSPKARYIWTVAELMRDKQATGSAVGRFEVEGSYDIGHLV